jgi:hypothetical protein
VGGFAIEDHEYFNIPGLGGSGLVAFPIHGNSMEPVIYGGDMVICRELQGLHEIRDNKIYAVKNNGTIWVKYVQKITDKNNRVVQLKMISANHLEHDPFIEDVNEHPYRIERMLIQLLHSGVIDSQRAVLVGYVNRYALAPHDRGYDLPVVLKWLRARTKTPIVVGLPFGHDRPKLTLPHGATVGLATEGRQGWLVFDHAR